MTEATANILLWMLLAFGLGLAIGWVSVNSSAAAVVLKRRSRICVASLSTPELSPWTAGSDRCTAP